MWTPELDTAENRIRGERRESGLDYKIRERIARAFSGLDDHQEWCCIGSLTDDEWIRRVDFAST